MTVTKIYPFDLPSGVHPFEKYLLGFNIPDDIRPRLATHLGDSLGMRLDESRTVWKHSWCVGLPSIPAGDREQAEVGDRVELVVSERGAVRVTGGALPPGLRLEKHSGKIVGVLTHSGLYSVTVSVGPTVKYDPLGSPGGPHDPGVWIPWEQPRQVPQSNLSSYPATVDDLSDLEKDRLLAELMAERDSKTIQEADK